MIKLIMMRDSLARRTSAVSAVARISCSAVTLVAANDVDTDGLGCTVLRIADALIYVYSTHHPQVTSSAHAFHGHYILLRYFLYFILFAG